MSKAYIYRDSSEPETENEKYTYRAFPVAFIQEIYHPLTTTIRDGRGNKLVAMASEGLKVLLPKLMSGSRIYISLRIDFWPGICQ